MQATDDRLGRQIIAYAALAAFASTLIAILYPLGSPGVISGASHSSWLLSAISVVSDVGWIACQSFLLTAPGIIGALSLARFSPRAASVIGHVMVSLLPALMVLDAATFGWIGHRFLSAATWSVATELREGLLGHVSTGMFRYVLLNLALLAGVLTAAFFISRRTAHRWQIAPSSPSPSRTLSIGFLLAAIASIPSLVTWNRTQQRMIEHSSRHPLSVLGWVTPDLQDPPQRPTITSASSNGPKRAVTLRQHQQRRLAVDLSDSSKRPMPDILIVVIESLRREVVSPDVMPHLNRYARSGTLCQNHFSGGNATNHGMFSLFNGLEAVWYESPVRFTPLLNRLFRQAGYELGFFAGYDDWRKFYMDGYIDSKHYDVFHSGKNNGLASDRRATQLAAQFLDDERSSGAGDRPPRLAVLYLYATHATYNSYPEDQIFEPFADDRFLYPYTDASRDRVWNRYKNSAHTIDRFLSAVMRHDRVMIVTGDHGEAFLEDGTVGHGVRISEFQNMTPAIFYAPNASPQVIDQPTFHGDLLPTLLSAVGVKVNDASAFDGVNLLDDRSRLGERSFATRNYLAADVALIGPWTTAVEGPFAYRINVSLQEPSFRAVDAINHRGGPQTCDPARIDDAMRRWLEARFGW